MGGICLALCQLYKCLFTVVAWKEWLLGSDWDEDHAGFCSQSSGNAIVKNVLARQFAMEVVHCLREAGHEALWAGGCVRDLLRGSEPTDYDVATSALPLQVQELFGRRRTHAVGISFGVIIVRAPKRGIKSVEVATFRTDASYSDGRHPDSVSFSTAEEDAQRRDFTINGMFYDPFQDRVIDYVGGQRDLQGKVVRAIGNARDRFTEDKLRMLRAIRFAARFAFQIEPKTRQAIAACADEVAVVSGERIASEIQSSLQTSHAAWAVAEWADLGLLPVILPELAERWAERSSQASNLLNAMPTANWQTKLGGLLFATWGPQEEPIRAMKTRLKLSNLDANAISFTVTSQPVLEQAHRLPWSQVQPMVIHPSFSEALNLLDARCRLGLDPHCGDWLRHQLANITELDPPPLVGGQDLENLGLKPGPAFRLLLDRVRTLQLDERLHNRQQALEWLSSEIEQMDV